MSEPAIPVFMSLREAKVLSAVDRTPAPVEQIVARTGLGTATVRSSLSSLVRRGLAMQHPGGRYSVAGVKASPGRARQEGDVRFRVGGSSVSLLVGDAADRLSLLGHGIADAFVMSPPFWKERDYGVKGQIGWEPTAEAFAERVVDHLVEVKPRLSPFGLVFVQFDDHRDGKLSCIDSLILGQRHRIGFEKHHEIIWHKPNPFPNGTDRTLTHAYEKILVFRHAGAESDHYWDVLRARQEAKEGGWKRMEDVWTIPTAVNGHSKGKHRAAFPIELVRRCLDVGTSDGGYCPQCRAPWERELARGASTWTAGGASHHRSRIAALEKGVLDRIDSLDKNGKKVEKKMAEMAHVGWRPGCDHGLEPVRALIVDPYVGSGTTGLAAVERGFDFVGIDLNQENILIAEAAIRKHATDERVRVRA